MSARPWRGLESYAMAHRLALLVHEPDPDSYNAEKQAKALRAAARLLLKHADAVMLEGSYYSGAIAIEVNDGGIAHMQVGRELWKLLSKGRKLKRDPYGREQVVVNGVVVFR